MAVRFRVIAGVFIVTVAFLIVSTAIAYFFGNRVLQAHEREQLRRRVILQLEQLLSTLKDAETGQRGFVLTGDDKYLEPYEQAIEKLQRDVAKFKAMRRLDVSLQDVQRVDQLIQAKLAELRSTIELRRTNGLDAAVAAMKSGEGRQLMDDLRTEIGRLQERKMAALEQDVRRSDQSTRTRTLVFIVTGLLDVLVLGWAFLRIMEALKERDNALLAEQRRALELQMQKNLLSVTLSSIGDCVMVTDRETRITFMNPVAENLTGWKLSEAIGRPVGEVFRIISEATRAPVESPVDKVMREGVIVGLANHSILIRKDGAEIPIDDSGAPIRDVDGTIRGVVLVFRDFSEHKRVERELRKAKDEAETANKAKDQFLAMLSHELRTPLTPVLATLNLWEASEDVPKALHPDVQMLRRSVELEARIIDDLLDLTRIARGMFSFSAENTDVHSLLEFLVGLSRSEFQEKNLRVSVNLEARQHIVNTDVARLQQVIWNILRNAIKFTDKGGAVTITTSNDDKGSIDIVVKDTGIGMTEETLARLFVPFEQADRTRKSRYGGLGLGMAISNALVELLEGKLSAKSEGLGHGSTFTVSFPTVTGSTPTVSTTRAAAHGRDKVRLLLIEDHDDTARALVRLLQSRGFVVSSVGTVASACETAENGKFDLFLCDLGLPDGTGFDFIQKMRQKNDVPAVALTGFGMQQDVERAQAAGFNAHLTKPVNLQKLEATIWKLLQDR